MNNTIIIGDVHGHWEELAAILEGQVYSVPERKALLLGDLVDRGPDSGKTIAVAHKLKQDGKLEALIVGNHEHKLYRKFIGRDVKLGRDAQRSFDEITAQGQVEAFKSLVEGSYVVYSQKTADLKGWNLFIHGAPPSPYLRAEVWEQSPVLHITYLEYLAMSKKQSGYLEPAFYGYTDGTQNAEGFPTRLLDWLDRVPANVTVYKGHDAMYKQIHEHVGHRGGKTVFMDTGSGKEGGKLSWRLV